MRWLGRGLGAVIIVLGAFVLFIVADASWGMLLAIAATVVPVMVMPPLLGMVQVREEDAWRPSAGMRRWSRGAVTTALFMLVMFAATARCSVADAFSGLPDRHPGLGGVGRAVARVGRALTPRR